MIHRCACCGGAALSVDACKYCSFIVLFVYINCVICVYIMICIGYARTHDVGAAHSE